MMSFAIGRRWGHSEATEHCLKAIRTAAAEEIKKQCEDLLQGYQTKIPGDTGQVLRDINGKPTWCWVRDGTVFFKEDP
jgi:hypothetical protein